MLLGLFIIVVVLALIIRVGRRSGVTSDDIARKLPGDDVLVKTGAVLDRATIIQATPEEIWPWIQQLGKGRAGWYAPLWLERLLVRDVKRRGNRKIVAKYQKLQPGEVVPDWGPASLQVISIESNHALVYGSIKKISDKPDYLFSWSHVLEPINDSSTKLYTRLRMRPSKHWYTKLFMPLGGFFDYLTIVAMYAGLKERLKEGQH